MGKEINFNGVEKCTNEACLEWNDRSVHDVDGNEGL